MKSNVSDGTVKKTFFRRKTKGCPLMEMGASKVNYKNPKLLLRFVSERGRVLPRRITYVSAKMQRVLKTEIKKARMLALLPFVNS